MRGSVGACPRERGHGTLGRFGCEWLGHGREHGHGTRLWLVLGRGRGRVGMACPYGWSVSGRLSGKGSSIVNWWLLLAGAGSGWGAVGLPDVGNVTATAILGWYAWHTASRAIPQLVKDFREEMAENRCEYRSERDAFRSELAAERRERHEDNQAIVAALRELSSRMPLRDCATNEGARG